MKAFGTTIAGLVVAGAIAACSVLATEPTVSFFVTSKGLGDGGNLGGLAGADQHCQQLAQAAGAGNRLWAAYLSTQGPQAVNARDRIGNGPWHNAKGQLIARNLEELHNQVKVNITHETALDELGHPVPYVKVGADGLTLPLEYQKEVEHDIFTGSQLDGTAFPPGGDRTCHNWTSNGEGAGMLGHHDRRVMEPVVSPWNSVHPSRGCSQQNLLVTGGSGRFYCFAK